MSKSVNIRTIALFMTFLMVFTGVPFIPGLGGVESFAAVPTGPIGHWEFNDSIADLTGNTWGAPYVSPTPATYEAGKFGKAIAISTAAPFVKLPALPSALSGASGVTFAAWVKLNNATEANEHTIFSIRPFDSNAGGNVTYFLKAQATTGKLYLKARNSNSASPYAELYGGASLSSNTWHHIAGVVNYANKELRIYVNGSTTGAGASITTTLGGSQPTVDPSNVYAILGSHPTMIPASDFLNGSIGDAYVYNKALTNTEVTDLYNYSPEPTVTPDPGTLVPDIIIDNTDINCTFDSTWATSSASAGFYGTNYSYVGGQNEINASKWAKWTPTIETAGWYNVYMKWTSNFNRVREAPLEIKDNNGTTSKTLNQSQNGGEWVKIGMYNMMAGTSNYVKLSANDHGAVCADAVKFEYIPSDLVVNDFMNYQVVQRDIGGTSKNLTITGVSRLNVEKIQARVVKNGTPDVVVPWTDIATNQTSGKFVGSLTVPQGGWYNIQVQSLDSSNAVLSTSNGTNKWGVGMVILCAGQSNMNGQADAPYTVADDLVANCYSAVQWGHLVDPYAGTGGSMAPELGNKLAQQYKIPVAFVAAGKDGSGLVYKGGDGTWETRNAYDPANVNQYYGKSIIKARAAGGVELIIWNQGETDAITAVTKEEYKTKFTGLIGNFRTDLYSTIPIFLCQIGPHSVGNSSDSNYSDIRSAQAELDNPSNGIFMAATEIGLAQKADAVHYTASSLNIIGDRVANAIKYYFCNSTYYRGPEIVSAVFSDPNNRNIIDVKIRHRGGTDFAPASAIKGFSVIDNGTPISVTTADRVSQDTIRLTLASAVSDSSVIRYLYGLKPDDSNIVKDNTALQLPLECTTYDIQVKNIILMDIGCFAKDNSEILNGATLPASDNIKVTATLAKNPDVSITLSKLSFIVGLYKSNGQLINCFISSNPFDNQSSPLSITGYLATPSDTTGAYLKAFLWEDVGKINPILVTTLLPTK